MSKRNPYFFCLLLALAFSANANPGNLLNSGPVPNINLPVPQTEAVAIRQPEARNASNIPLILSIMALVISCGNVAYTIVVLQKNKEKRNNESNCTSTVNCISESKEPNAKKESRVEINTKPSKKEKKKKGKRTKSDNQSQVAVQEIQADQPHQNIAQESKKITTPTVTQPINTVKADSPSIQSPQKPPHVETYYVQPRMNGTTIVLIDAGEQNRVYAPLKIVSQKGKVEVYFNEDSLVNNLVNIEKTILPYVETATLNADSPRSIVTKNPGLANAQGGYWILTRKPIVDII